LRWVQRGEKAGFARFNGRDRFPSCTDKEVGNGARLDNGCLVLSTIGRLAVRWSRPLAGTPKTVSGCRAADGWSVTRSCAQAPSTPLPLPDQQTGSDRGREWFATLADGEPVPVTTPRRLRGAERHLRRAQQRVPRRLKGSPRRRTAVHLPARAHQRVRRTRADLHHKTALALARASDTIYHEDLQTAHLRRRQHRAKASADAGWSAFLRLRSRTAADAAKD
jgi:putative transposase